MSPQAIKDAIQTKVKHVFKTSLKCIEIKFGNEFEGYDQMRSEILRVGNNAIRELKELINEKFDLPEEEFITKVRFKNKEKDNV